EVTPTDWRKAFIQELTASEQREEYWMTWIEQLEKEKTGLFELENKLITDDITVETSNISETKQDLKSIEKRLQSNKSLESVLYQLLNKALHYLIKDPVINNSPIRTLSDVEKVFDYILFQEKKEKALLSYNRNIQRII